MAKQHVVTHRLNRVRTHICTNELVIDQGVNTQAPFPFVVTDRQHGGTDGGQNEPNLPSSVYDLSYPWPESPGRSSLCSTVSDGGDAFSFLGQVCMPVLSSQLTHSSSLEAIGGAGAASCGASLAISVDRTMSSISLIGFHLSEISLQP